MVRRRWRSADVPALAGYRWLGLVGGLLARFVPALTAVVATQPGTGPLWTPAVLDELEQPGEDRWFAVGY